MAKFQLKIIPRQAEYGSSKELGQAVRLCVTGAFFGLQIGAPSLGEPNAAAELHFGKWHEHNTFTVTAVDENFRLDIIFDTKDERKKLKDMYIQNASAETHKSCRDPKGKPLATLFVRSWEHGQHWQDPMMGAKFIEGLQIDCRYAINAFDMSATSPNQYLIHPLERYIGPDDVPNDGQEEPMQ